jgi:hypothetical protein
VFFKIKWLFLVRYVEGVHRGIHVSILALVEERPAKKKNGSISFASKWN